jgi:hypothetical protein
MHAVQRGSAQAMKANKRIEFAAVGRPTRKGDAPLLAAHSQR